MSTTKIASKKAVRELKSLRASARNNAANLQCCCYGVPKAQA